MYYTKGCNTQFSAPEDGRDQRPKYVELIVIVNKPLFLRLVGCLYYLFEAEFDANPFLLLTSVVLASRYDGKTALTRRHKNAQNKHTLLHSRTPIGIMVHEG